MRNRAVVIAAVAATLTAVALAAGAAIAKATSGDDGAPLTGKTLAQASAAALQATGGGKVNETEYDSEDDATYEVEVTKPNGETVDVRLDGAFDVIAVEGDQEDGGGDSGE